ncbi:Glycerol-3-phosphate responsive antiterminator [uncultured Ruminococcus sp.]|uniref:Glycerol-3-phosphate responsive antiterminator n=1 Tax=Massiliimalia timonensis TaxID=1987501 RepID=A0A8J6P2I5_9FIRM|nr:glycerol-3-phosphate responsive antiterminator [Massiliimalia timonensis]MBC8611736.1 glycerol-3-phosphate responsive antiterminator [Massiliimalia timonensis]MBS7176814.1 glycerol-3-phosphate responsive antiterminator [Clostridiales bacterium]SCH60744.1 Glycerol-3-phosphate responsive antiterminator [uncultured Clostridium sp.]SCH74634.1 Glycerol-3-phosphate responsive antiterminator [uncultured Ruminococcus sp.]
MTKQMIAQLEEMPIIAAVKNEEELELAICSECPVVFVLYGDICTISGIVSRIKAGGKIAIVHVDLIEGLESKPVAVQFLKQNTHADGIISTKPTMIKASKEAGLITIQRFFVLDSRAFENIQKHISLGLADFVEVLPGVMPKVIRKLANEINVPLIAGGLITDKDDVISALGAGATAVSTTLSSIWKS